MQKTLWTLFFSCLFSILSLRAQESAGIRITFVLNSPDLPDTTSVYITGSIEALGRWNPGKIKMDAKGNHVWTKE